MDQIKRRERETAEAARWLHILEEASQSNKKEFLIWLRESPANVSEFLHLMHLHDSLKRFKRWDQIRPEPEVDHSDVVFLSDKPALASNLRSIGRPRKGIRLVAILAGTAAAAAIAAVAFIPPSYSVISTDRGERRLATLDDGSEVQLAPDTVLRVSLRAQERDIWLEKGNALFHVAKDPRRAFFVASGNSTVQSVGTVFDVERHKDNGMTITVAEGKVAVLPSRNAPYFRKWAPASMQSLLMVDIHQSSATPGQKLVDGAVYVRAGQQLAVSGAGARTLNDVNTNDVLGWAAIRLVFKATPLSEVVEECNRYSGIRLIVRDDELARRPVTGVFNASDPETLLAFIEAAADVRVTPEGQKTLVVTAQ